MKRRFMLPLAACSALSLLAGCSWQIGGGPGATTIKPTVGQQLMDLQKAKEAGAITESEYQAQKAKVLHASREPGR
jgi:hypothetical protein